MSVVPNPGSPGPNPRRSALAALVCGAVVALAGAGAMFLQRFKAAAPPAPERTAAELIRRDGVLMQKSDNRPFSGWLVEHQSPGSLRSRSWISNGVLNGISEGWHTNGVLQIREQFVDGLGEGQVTRWRDDGSKLSEGFARAGKLEGHFRRWHANGQLAEEVIMNGGEPQGSARAWFPSGCLKSEVLMDRGKVVSQHFWKDGENNDRSVAAAHPRSP